MSLPVPLGVRVHGIINSRERWITRWVDDITFRSVIPGGFASATITLRVPRDTLPGSRPDLLGFTPLAEMFERVQIVDLRTMEIAWEGRIEDPARQVDPDTWQIGVLGSMVVTTDVQRPVFYVDSQVDKWDGDADYWTAGGFDGVAGNFTPWDNKKNENARTVTTVFRAGGWVFGDGQITYGWRWDSHGYDQPIARFTTTHDGFGPSLAEDQNFSIIVGISANGSIDVTGVEAAEATKTNVIGTDFTDQNTRYIVLGYRRDAGTGDYQPGQTAGDAMQVRWSDPKVVGMRRDRTGAKLVTAASYTTDYVTVAQIVEDVVGRFLVGGWYENALNTPWSGSVRSTDVYIDATDTTQILHLTYPDGATAADILNDLMTKVQTNAYWAIWESTWRANDSSDYPAASGFRIEWATWPNNWGYLATMQDGFEGQPNGDDVYNFVFYRYPKSSDNNAMHVDTGWLGFDMAPELLTGGFTRAFTVNKEDPVNGGAPVSALNGKKKVLNAGTLTVKRPIQFYDAGANSSSGAGRMVDPWMIRPGKLLRITDLPPRALEQNVALGTTLPSSVVDGTLFKVVATEYSSSENACRLELDQVTRWQVPTQISSGSTTKAKTIRIQ